MAPIAAYNVQGCINFGSRGGQSGFREMKPLLTNPLSRGTLGHASQEINPDLCIVHLYIRQASGLFPK